MEEFKHIQDDDYVCLPASLRIKHGLKGSELIVASIIFRYSLKDGSKFYGSLRYLCEWTGLTKQAVITILQKLVREGVIEKEEVFTDGIKRCYYTYIRGGKKTLPLLNSVERGGKETLIGVVKKLERGIKETLPNNKDKSKEENKDRINLPTNVGMSQSDPVNQAVDYEKLKTCFNDELSKQNAIIPKLASVTDKRKHAINARVKEHGKEAFFKVIKKAAASPFLNGRNNRSFVASFDWLIKPNNFIKVLEGNYDENLNTMYNGNNRSDYEREQRARDAVEIVERLFAADDAERQAATDAGV